MSNFVFQPYINLPLWDRAVWRGVGWFWIPNMPPGMGLFFANEKDGSKIFHEWRERLGDTDTQEQLRVSIIEGSIVAAAPGYNVRIGTNIPNFLRVAKEHGFSIDTAPMLVASRIHRMNPPPASPNLANFKRAYETHKTYALVQVVQDSSSQMGMRPLLDTVVMKSEIFFRNVEDIVEGDPDADARVAP